MKDVQREKCNEIIILLPARFSCNRKEIAFFMPDPCIRVQMFGSFRIDVCGQPTVFGEGRNSKSILALQVLLYHYPHKVPRDLLLEILFSNGESSDPSANLRVSIFRLKRFLKNPPLQDFFRICSDANYRWLECSIPLSVDAAEFRELYGQALQTTESSRQLSLFQKAEQLYSDDFLRFSAANSWLQSIQALLQQNYLSCVEHLIRLMRKRNQWAELYPIVLKACRMHPVEYFYCVGIDCLLAQNQYRDAKQLYLRALHVLRDELSVTPSRALLEHANQINQLLFDGHETIYDLRRQLCESEQAQGPYYCSPSSFADVFRMVCRMTDRSNTSTCLMLYSFSDFQGRSIHDSTKISLAGKSLRNALQHCLRRCDTFTQYRSGQYIVLLTNTSDDGFSVVHKRIREYYHAHAVRGVHLRCIQQNVDSSFFLI